MPVSSRLLSRVAGSGPWWLGLGVPPRRARLARRPPARLRFPFGHSIAWLLALRRSGPCAARFAPPVLVASCPSCSARSSTRAVGPSAAWLLCPFCGSCAFLPAAAWRPAPARVVAAPALQPPLF